MAATCSNGHDSDWDDYCSVCGESLGGPAPNGEAEASASQATVEPAVPVPPENAAQPESEAAEQAAGPECPNCGESHAEGDIFCENCGLDLLSGTLPEVVEPAPVDPGAAPSVAVVSVDLVFFERMQFAGVEPPADLPEPVTIELPPTDILVGRQSDSRGTFPEIDLASVFGDDSPATDPAVSSSHCRLHRGVSGWTVTDLGSTNGTYVGDETDPLAAGRAMNLTPGTPIYVGAWTKIELSDS